MSDGPWRSLPMQRHWKQVAKQAENIAFSPEELSESLKAALQKEIRDLPFEAVVRKVVPNGQGVLFSPDVTGEIEALQRDFPDSKAAQTFLAYVLDGVASGPPNPEWLESALADTLDECAFDNSRSIEEHFLRDSRSPETPIHLRLESARHQFDFLALASQMLAPSSYSGQSLGPAKRSGLDDGPLL